MPIGHTETTVVYRIDSPLEDAALNGLFGRVWANHTPRAFAPVLSRSLATVTAHVADELIGFVNIATDGGAHAFLLDPTVDPTYQRSGVGLRLVRTAVELARERGCEWIHVDFEPHLAPFYAAAGFRASAAGVLHLDRPG